jgi:hypothetical protein
MPRHGSVSTNTEPPAGATANSTAPVPQTAIPALQLSVAALIEPARQMLIVATIT